jgi:hypothetical protein
MTNQRYSDADIEQALKRVSAKIPGPISVTRYENNRLATEPSSALLIQRFGSWRSACGFAKVETYPASRSYKSQHSQAEVIKLVKIYLAQQTKPSYKGFADWLKAQPAAPSAQTCRNLVGSWQQLLDSAKA